MILSALALSISLLPAQDAKPVLLNRVFAKGEKLAYQVRSNLHVEEREYGSATFMPDDFDLNYDFSFEVKSLKNDGFAQISYQRPTMTLIQGENFQRGAVTKVEKVNYLLDLTVSPVNDIVEMKDVSKKPDPKKGSGKGGKNLSIFAAQPHGSPQNPISAFMSQFVGELHRLALNVGALDSAMDFAPKLPFDEVKVGDTWKKTVGYSPQKLTGKDGKSAVQRMDYTFTYKGLVSVNGKQFYRVNASLDMNTDIGAFLNQMMKAKPEESGLKSIPMNLKQSIDYDLDLATKRTVRAESRAEGGFKVNVTQVTSEPVVEHNFKGTTSLRLVSVGK